MKDLSNKNVSPVPLSNSSDLHHFQTVPSAELRTQKKTGLSFDSFLSPPFPTYVTEVMHVLNMKDGRPPVLVLTGESCGGGEGSIKLRLLFLTGVLDVLMYVVLLFVSLALLLRSYVHRSLRQLRTRESRENWTARDTERGKGVKLVFFVTRSVFLISC